MTDKQYAIARKRVKRKKHFYRHLSVYTVMGCFFYVLNILTNPGHYWFYWPMLGWGLGLAMHYVAIFGVPGLVEEMGEDWENKEIEKEMRRMGHRPPQSNPTPEPERLDLPELEKKPERKWDDDQLVWGFWG